MDFHGGITFYQRLFSTDDKKMIQIGCDYQHLDDNLTDWDEQMLATDAKEVIDQIHNSAEYLIWCSGNGKLYPESAGIYTNEDKSSFRSAEYQETQANKVLTDNTISITT